MNEDLPFGTRGGLAVRHYFPARRRIFGPRAPATARPPARRSTSVSTASASRRSVVAARNRADEEAETRSAAGELEVRVPVRAGARVISVSLARKAGVPEGLGPAQLPVTNIAFRGRAGAETGIEKIEVGGPYDSQGPGDTPSRRRIFTCRPPNASSGEDCARQILTRLARRAYRRPASEKDVRRLLEFYDDARARHGFEAGIQAALERLLVDPEFLFRIERDPRRLAARAPTV